MFTGTYTASVRANTHNPACALDNWPVNLAHHRYGIGTFLQKETKPLEWTQRLHSNKPAIDAY